MKRFLLATGWCLLLLAMPLSSSAWAQDEGDDAAAQPADPNAGDQGAAEGEDGLPPEAPKPPPPSDATLSSSESGDAAAPADMGSGPKDLKGKEQRGWKDIVVLPRKIFLKRRRVEVQPLVGTTINDNLMQHTALGGELNYHITDALSVGALGMYYFHNVLNQEFFTRYHFELVPTLNKYVFTATANMAYVPIYGKFALFNYWILQYEIFVTGGVGVTGTEIIPRSAEDEVFSTMALTIPLGGGLRLFVNRWLSFQLTFRDFMMLDKYEAPGRQHSENGEQAKANAEGRFVQNVIVNVGVGFFFPLDFNYTTFR